MLLFFLLLLLDLHFHANPLVLLPPEYLDSPEHLHCLEVLRDLWVQWHLLDLVLLHPLLLLLQRVLFLLWVPWLLLFLSLL